MSELTNLETNLMRHLKNKFEGEAKKADLLTSIGAYQKPFGEERGTILESLEEKGLIVIEKRRGNDISVGKPGIYVTLK